MKYLVSETVLKVFYFIYICTLPPQNIGQNYHLPIFTDEKNKYQQLKNLLNMTELLTPLPLLLCIVMFSISKTTYSFYLSPCPIFKDIPSGRFCSLIALFQTFLRIVRNTNQTQKRKPSLSNVVNSIVKPMFETLLFRIHDLTY